MRFDWKYTLSFIVALVGIAIPMGLWQLDQNVHSITVRLVASTALQPQGKQSIPDIEVSIGGVKLQSPYLSTLELINTGSKPIQASDFETPVELALDNHASVVRARVSLTNPNEIKADLMIDKDVIILKPLLLNPSDSITLTVITTGDSPVFSPKARIAGVSRIAFEDATTKTGGWKTGVGMYIFGLIFAILYFVYAVVLFFPEAIKLTRPIALITMIACSITGARGLELAYKSFGVERNVLVTSITVFVIGIAMFPFFWRARKRHWRSRLNKVDAPTT